MTKLVLFDLDGTLLSTQGAGMRAMAAAGRKLFGECFHFEGVVAAGQLDPHLFEAGARNGGIVLSDEHHVAFLEMYAQVLPDELVACAAEIQIMPGVLSLLDELHRHDRVTMGLLTGNFSRTAPLKLEAAGIDPSIFQVNAFGDDGSDRESLVPVAMARYEALHGREVDPRSVIIIGDTPRDVQCAKAHGCWSIAVATGPCSIDDLRAAGADYAVADLSDPTPLWNLIDS